uniref:Alpha-S2-casein n=1 Tax=Castor canadensis TaxID=51338 RepID=A0A8C0WU21_CASCN
MKFFIFTCLLAVALAKHEIKQFSSSEESVNISQEKYKQDNNVVFQTSQESSSRSSSEKNKQTEEEKVNVKELNKIKQFYQDFYFPLYRRPQPLQIVMNPWNNNKENAYHDSPVLGSTNIFQEEIFKKIVDMIKSNQFHQLTIPQYFQAIYPQQRAVNPWDPFREYTYSYVPFVRNF